MLRIKLRNPFVVYRALSTKEREKRLRKILLGDASIWCRNGQYSKKAVHCIDVPCMYKKIQCDIISGPVKCGTFQLTTMSNDWHRAIHIAELGEVKLYIE